MPVKSFISAPSSPLFEGYPGYFPEFGRTDPYQTGCNCVILRKLKALQSSKPWLRVRSKPT